ncbi:MAG: hypothetical protein R3330_12020, partial [Saprospiraceae bacterium]|nr:hypothetical protein [Saprospiraceae bacterium]
MIGMPNSGVLSIAVGIMIGSWFFLIANLILHVVLRGFWISAIGVRYVSGDIDFDRLRLAPKFDRYLRRRIPSFDDFIERLEKVCSVVFAFTFLIIFILLACGMFIVLIAAFDELLTSLLKPHVSPGFYEAVDQGINIILVLTGLIYFIDFVTLGWIKRRRWLARVYYPFYRFYSLVTLSFLYRPLYYNLIDDKFGRRVALLLIPYMIVVGVIASVQTEGHLYFSTDETAFLSKTHYAESLEKHDVLSYASIPSRYVENGFLEVFIPYTFNDNRVVDTLCPGIVAGKKLGVNSSAIKFSGPSKNVTSADSLLLCVSQVSRIHVNDSLVICSPYFYTHPNQGEYGLLHVLDVSYLPRGKHQLLVEKQRFRSDTLRWLKHASFPFWVE